MHKNLRAAFSMIELTFVIVVIGILAAIAIPRFGDSADSAYFTKAKSTIVTVRNSIANERQRRILRGDYTAINDLSLTSTGTASSNVFDHFNADNRGVNTPVFDYPVPACSGTQRGCWTTSGTAPNKQYIYRFNDASDGTDGQAVFVLQNNRLDCLSSDTSDCQKVIR